MKRGFVILMTVIYCLACHFGAQAQAQEPLLLEEIIQPFLELKNWTAPVTETIKNFKVTYKETVYYEKDRIVAKQISSLSGIILSFEVRQEDGSFKIAWEYCGHVDKLPPPQQ